jgi:hypothetical protein
VTSPDSHPRRFDAHADAPAVELRFRRIALKPVDRDAPTSEHGRNEGITEAQDAIRLALCDTSSPGRRRVDLHKSVKARVSGCPEVPTRTATSGPAGKPEMKRDRNREHARAREQQVAELARIITNLQPTPADVAVSSDEKLRLLDRSPVKSWELADASTQAGWPLSEHSLRRCLESPFGDFSTHEGWLRIWTGLVTGAFNDVAPLPGDPQ